MAFEDYEVARWSVGDFDIAFPVVEISDRGGNRIVQRERPFRDGAKLDDTGSKARVWQLRILFESSIEEPGLSEVNQGLGLYPTVLNHLIRSFDVHETGDLYVPTIGRVRARVQDFSRVDQADLRDAAMLDVTWVEDNEDNLDFERAVNLPRAEASARRLGTQTTFDAQTEAIYFSQLTADIESSLGELEDLANTPDDVANDIDLAASTTIQSSNKLVEIFSNPHVPGRDTFNTVRGGRTERQLEMSKDMAARSRNEARKGRPQVVAVQLLVPSSIAALSAALGQDFSDLLAINPSIDPLYIPKGAIVKVFSNDSTG